MGSTGTRDCIDASKGTVASIIRTADDPIAACDETWARESP